MPSPHPGQLRHSTTPFKSHAEFTHPPTQHFLHLSPTWPKLPNDMLYEIVARVRDDLPTLDALIATGDPELGDLASRASEGNWPYFQEACLKPLHESLGPAGRTTPDFHQDHFLRLCEIDHKLLIVAFNLSGSPIKQTHTLDIDLLPAEFEWAAARAVEFGLEPSSLAGRGLLTVSCSPGKTSGWRMDWAVPAGRVRVACADRVAAQETRLREAPLEVHNFEPWPREVRAYIRPEIQRLIERARTFPRQHAEAATGRSLALISDLLHVLGLPELSPGAVAWVRARCFEPPRGLEG